MYEYLDENKKQRDLENQKSELLCIYLLSL